MIVMTVFLFASQVLQADINDQEWLPNPRIKLFELNKQFRACMENEIQLQGKYQTGKRLFWTGVRRDSEQSKGLKTSFCHVNEAGYCQESFTALIETSDLQGWQNDNSEFPNFYSVAKDMGRYIQFKNAKTGETSVLLDVLPCVSYFGI